MNISKPIPEEMEVGVAGLGLMGSSIIVSLLAAGHRVKAIAPIAEDLHGAEKKIKLQLENCARLGLLKKSIAYYLDKVEITMDYHSLAGCGLVMECVIEDISIKARVYRKITDVVADDTIISSNTSALAITLLQQQVSVPERFMGIHFAEPAYATRFLEITCGEQTRREYTDRIFHLAHSWGKEPTLLQKDIKGFITNRLMYAVYREIFHLIETGKTNLEDADKAFRYDVGSWITLMGIFRRMDYTGLADHAEIFKTIFPNLSNSADVPAIMEKIVREHGRGIQNLNGLYQYSPAEAAAWARAFAAFNEDIYHLAAMYPSGLLEKEKTLTN